MEDQSLLSDFGSYVKRKRQAMGLSQSQLADRLYGNPKMKTYISAIETGKIDPGLKSAGQILIALNSWVQFIE